MAAINELISRIQDPELRASIQAEVDKLSRQKKFGLVFEDHIPECTPLYELPIRVGTMVARKSGSINDLMLVSAINGDSATCLQQGDGASVEVPLTELVAAARFGEPIYPYLKPIDAVCNAPDNDLWHTLIEADNYHALQLLEYLYAGQVDCIYIDPPYNNGATDWKYNDAYIDGSDAWAHSKWLSMMKKRLLLAKELLSSDGVMIISISHHEVHRLNLLLGDLFLNRQIVTITVQTSGGKSSGGFKYLHEYLVFVIPEDFSPNPTSFSGGKVSSPFHGMNLASFTPVQRPNQVYPIYINRETREIVGCGKSIQERIQAGLFTGPIDEFVFNYDEAPQGCCCVWPVTSKGAPCVWRLIPSRMLSDLKKGYIKVVEQKSAQTKNEFGVQFLAAGIIKKIKANEIEVLGRESVNNTIILGEYKTDGSAIPTIWTEKAFYTAKGTSQIQEIFGGKDFPYPKPINLIYEIIQACTKDDSIIVDFFAGSGTTLQAVNLLNAEDGGHRKCVIVTNNEVSPKEESELKAMGLSPGDPEYEKHGIARSVTWPRTLCTIEGHDIDGRPFEGDYPDIDRPMAEGLPANVAFFKLGFLDKASVRVGRQFREMLPTLWMKAGCHGPCPTCDEGAVPDMLILPQNHMAVLNDNSSYAAFAERVEQEHQIDTVYLVTDSDADYRSMAKGLSAPHKYQLYRDYLDNFRINSKR